MSQNQNVVSADAGEVESVDLKMSVVADEIAKRTGGNNQTVLLLAVLLLDAQFREMLDPNAMSLCFGRAANQALKMGVPKDEIKEALRVLHARCVKQRNTNPLKCLY